MRIPTVKDLDKSRTALTDPNPGSCGNCTLCCTVMKVTFDDGSIKPERTRCEHLCQGKAGCSIYEHRPQTCQGFECLWLGSQRDERVAWPNHERPDRTGVVMEVNQKENVIVHCKTPEAWRSDKVLKRLKQFNNVTNVIIDHGNGQVSVLEKDGRVTPMRFIGLDPETNERKFVRDLRRDL